MKAMAAAFLRSAFGGESQAHMRYLIYAATAAENLEIAGGERFEIEHMYPAYLAEAERVGEVEAKRSFHYALEATKKGVSDLQRGFLAPFPFRA